MQAVLLILTPLFPALCALLCWFVPALRPDKARDRFVLASLVASFLLTVALCLTGDGSLTLFTISQNLPVGGGLRRPVAAVQHPDERHVAALRRVSASATWPTRARSGGSIPSTCSP